MEYIIGVLTIVAVQAFKDFVPKNFVPLLSVGIGLLFAIAYGLLAKISGPELLDIAIQGVTAGLMASGSYDLVKGILLEGKNKGE